MKFAEYLIAIIATVAMFALPITVLYLATVLGVATLVILGLTVVTLVGMFLFFAVVRLALKR
jgi:hypothetical protein